MCDPYDSREQSKAKHFILRRYLQTLAFKVLRGWDTLTYVDGFSGPWESKTPDFSDTSFMIAIQVLKDVQQRLRNEGRRVAIRCFFVEKDLDAFAMLHPAVMAHHSPANGFHVETFDGEFETAVPRIVQYVDGFTLTFIDPKGWTGYGFDRVGPLLRHQPGEVLVNIMYDFMNRFLTHPDPEIEASFEPILGGPGWKDRLDPNLSHGAAVLKLFREELKAAGGYEFATTTKIDKTFVDRPHYFLAYSTRKPDGLKAFRQVEWEALRMHDRARRNAKADREAERRAEKTDMDDLFAGENLAQNSSIEALAEATAEALAEEAAAIAKHKIVEVLRRYGKPVQFKDLWAEVLEEFMLRVMNVKDICVELADKGVIEAPWKADNRRKPDDNDLIVLKEY